MGIYLSCLIKNLAICDPRLEHLFKNVKKSRCLLFPALKFLEYGIDTHVVGKLLSSLKNGMSGKGIKVNVKCDLTQRLLTILHLPEFNSCA